MASCAPCVNDGTKALTREEIAIIGMSGRFPGAANVEANYGENLLDKKNGISRLDPRRPRCRAFPTNFATTRTTSPPVG
jgi:acyl transferase domain-containing protein